MEKNLSTDRSDKDHEEAGAGKKGWVKYAAAWKRAMAGSRGVIAGLMLLPLAGLAILCLIHFDDIRTWRWESAEHWLWLVSVVFVVASHVLMLVLLCREPNGDQAPKDRAD